MTTTVTPIQAWYLAYDAWLADCLVEFNEAYNEARTMTNAPDDGLYDPGDLVEFSEDGSAYPHGVGGTNWIPEAVKPWTDSPHFLD